MRVRIAVLFASVLSGDSCFAGELSFARCCLQQESSCWGGGYTFEGCCFKDVLTKPDVKALGALHECCPIGYTDGMSDVDKFWCDVRESAMLSWDLKPKFMQFLQLNEAEVAQCASGSMTFMILHLALKAQMGEDFTALPTWAWVQEAFRIVLEKKQLHQFLTSGYHAFFFLSLLRIGGRVTPDASSACRSVPPAEKRFFSVVEAAVAAAEGGTSAPVPTDESIAFLAQQSSCPIGTVIGAWSAAMAMESFDKPSKALFDLANNKLASLSDPLRELVTTPWPAVEVLERSEHPERAIVSITKPLTNYVKDRPLRTPLINAPDYFFRVFPQREIASDIIRQSRMPFCGMRPFIKLIESVAHAGLPSLSVIEGGPHLGDCTCWAAAALRQSSTRFQALGIEAMSNAAALFKESVRINGFERVQVMPRALDEVAGKFISMRHEEGRNGQATRSDLYPQCEDCHDIGVETTSIDDEWKGPLDVLKLSVNGAELKTLRGARKLLSKRKVCMVLMHATKVQLGRDRPDFAADLYHILNETGMEVVIHRDREEEGLSTTERVEGPDQMDRLFTGEALVEARDYIFARTHTPECAAVNSHLEI